MLFTHETYKLLERQHLRFNCQLWKLVCDVPIDRPLKCSDVSPTSEQHTGKSTFPPFRAHLNFKVGFRKMKKKNKRCTG